MATTVQDHPNAVLLRALYADLTRVVDHATDDIVYHLAPATCLAAPRTCTASRPFWHANWS